MSIFTQWKYNKDIGWLSSIYKSSSCKQTEAMWLSRKGWDCSQKISIHRMWAFLLHLQAEESSVQKINSYISELFHRQNSITKRLNDQQHLLRLRPHGQRIRTDRSGAFIYMLPTYPKEETQGVWSIGDKTFRKTCKQIRHALDSWWNRVRASFIQAREVVFWTVRTIYKSDTICIQMENDLYIKRKRSVYKSFLIYIQIALQRVWKHGSN